MRDRFREPVDVLLLMLVAAVLVALGLAVVVKVTRAAADRLGLEPMGVLLFFGLAEPAADEFTLFAQERPLRRRPSPAARR